MCFTSVINTCFIFSDPFIHPIKNLEKGFIGSYQDMYSIVPVGHCWFLFNLYGYSMALLPIFVKYHPKHRNSETFERNNSESESRYWFTKYIRRHMVIPKNHEDFSSLVSKLIIGRLKIVMVPGFVITVIELLLKGSFPENEFCFWKDWYHHALFIFVYFLGYAFMSVSQASINRILEKTGLYYLISGTLLLLLGQARVPLGVLLPASPIVDRISLIALTGFGKWMFILGSYAAVGKICTKNLTIIVFLRHMSMPFYLLHMVVLRVIRAVTISLIFRLGTFNLILYVQDLSNFELLITVCKVFFGTLFTGIISYIIMKSPSSVKYCFGMVSSGSRNCSKHWLHEYRVLISLLLIRIFGYVIVKLEVVGREISQNYFP